MFMVSTPSLREVSPKSEGDDEDSLESLRGASIRRSMVLVLAGMIERDGYRDVY